jgi:SAM-dependent methyltransferase
MSWDPVWERVFRSRRWGKYPPEELIRFVARNFYDAPDRSQVRILDAGCGPGPGVWYLAREGFAAHGIDGSPAAIELARERLGAEGLQGELLVGDLTALTEHYPAGSFDAVVDVTSVQQNRVEAIERIVAQIHELLRPGGRVFSMLLAGGSWGDGLGTEVEPGTFVDVPEGPLAGAGTSHFFSLPEVERLFAGFAELAVDESRRTLGGRRHTYGHWVVEATK